MKYWCCTTLKCSMENPDINWINHSQDIANQVFQLEKPHLQFYIKKNRPNNVSNRMSAKQSNHKHDYMDMTTMFCNDMSGSLACRQRQFCSSTPQPWHWVKVKKSHPIHISRPTFALSQICKVKLKWFWCERQNFLWHQRHCWKRTENSHPRPGWHNHFWRCML